MVEFIPQNAETTETEQPLSTEENAEFSENEVEESQENTPQIPQESLEELVETHKEELPTVQADQEYFDETASAETVYHAPQEYSMDEVPYVKDDLAPLVYEDKEVGFAVDIFDRYGKKEDKWWRQLPGGNQY